MIILVYVDGKPIGATSLWRNDIDGKEAYQNAETSVIKSNDSNGVFAVMTMTKSKFISTKKGIPIYSFPNPNSFPGYQKMKWNIRWNRRVVFLPGISSNRQVPHIDESYALWWLIRRKRIHFIKRFGRYYLVEAAQRKYVGRLLGEVNKSTALHFPKSEHTYLMLYYDSDKETFYNKKMPAFPLVFYNVADIQAPYWKLDSI